MIGAILASVVVGLSMMPQNSPSLEKAASFPISQQNFISELGGVQEQARQSKNSLALLEILNMRNAFVSSTVSPENWSGLVLGVQSIQGKGGISVDIGGVELLAGVHVSHGLDTLIPPSNSVIFNALLKLERGDRVTFSGEFETNDGAAVEMSYSDQNSISNPEFLFAFSSLTLE